MLKNLKNLYHKKQKNMQIRKGIEYHSLYEYLGHPAGPKLGEKVNKASIKTKHKYVTQHVEQGDFKGEVFLLY